MKRDGFLRGGVLSILFTTAFATPVLAASNDKPTVIVSSKMDTEGGVLGNIIIDVLNAHGVKTENKLQLGGTPIVRKAILAGDIDIYPEYTGNAAFFFNKASDPLWENPEKAYQEAKSLDYAANKLVWLTPAPADNTWGIAVTSKVATEEHLTTMSDLANYISHGGKIKLAASSEFVNSPAALPSFEHIYHFTLKPNDLLILSGGNTAAAISAAAQGTDNVNAAMVYGTDGGIAASGLVVMSDNLHVQPVYQPTPVIREAILADYPDIAQWLKPVFLSLSLTTLQSLNAEVEVDGEPATAVAKDYLQKNGFLK